MTHLHVEVRSGAYADSVSLLQASRAVQDLPGVVAAQVAMATPLNIDVLTGMGFEVPAEATSNDLVVALRLDGPDDLAAALAGVEHALASVSRRPVGATELLPPRTTGSALRSVPDAVVLISVPGPSAMVEAMDAVEAGHDVMIFSDNVPVEQELALKRAATERGVLVMGPDCGTAVIDGVGLGFANVVSPGPVGIVAASGTGCQQVLALLDHAGLGVAQALGVGGRDLSEQIGGISTMAAMTRLDSDPDVELMLVISKPPHRDVDAAVRRHAQGMSTPVEMVMLGTPGADLTSVAESVLLARGVPVPAWPVVGSAARPTGGRLVRGLFVGGTLATEARLIAEEPVDADTGHTFVDFGDDAYTAGRAHPMVDPTIRLQHLAQAADDDDTAVLLLDVVLGHGAEPDPAALLAPAIATIRKPVVITVVGTDADPQGLSRQVQALADAGAEVYLSNAAATRRAIELLRSAT